MRYEAQTIGERLREAREAKGISQRDLSALAGVPQAQISRIEAGAVDPRVSSLVALANALDLDVTLVPLKALPAVRSLIRQSPASSSHMRAARDSALSQIEQTLRTLQDTHPKYESVQDLRKKIADLAHVRALIRDPESLTKIKRSIEKIDQSRNPADAIRQSARAISSLRNSLVHAGPNDHIDSPPRPAYTLDEDDDG